MKNVSFRIGIVDKISAGLKNIKGGFEKVAKAATTLQSHINDIDVINLSAAFDVLERMSGHIESATEASMSFGQVAMSIEATSNLISKVNGQIKELASSYNTFDTAMRSANTMMGLGEDVFLQMRESISDLSKEILNGLERCHGEK